MKEQIILGIDPGTNILGYGLIQCKGSKITLISTGILRLSKLDNHALKLKTIFERVLAIIDEYHPDALAIEAPFYGKNVQSMLKLGRAQGVAMAAGLYREVSITEYAPKKIKMAITGSGNASKEQVEAMLSRIVHQEINAETLDASDGLAAAVCHALQRGDNSSSTKPYNGWGNFVASNPKRIK